MMHAGKLKTEDSGSRKTLISLILTQKASKQAGSANPSQHNRDWTKTERVRLK